VVYAEIYDGRLNIEEFLEDVMGRSHIDRFMKRKDGKLKIAPEVDSGPGS